MNGLLNKIRNEHSTPQNTQAAVDDGCRPGRPAEPPAPCDACQSPAFWHSVYGGDLRCSVCNPWPSLSLVRQRWAVVVMTSEPGKPLAWERWEDGPHLELRKGLAVNCPGGRREVEAVEAVGKDGAV